MAPVCPPKGGAHRGFFCATRDEAMFYDTTLTARTQDSVPYIRLEADHDFRNLVARLLSALGGRRHASTARSLTSSPALSTCPPPVESAPLVLDRRGRLYVRHDEI